MESPTATKTSASGEVVVLFPEGEGYNPLSHECVTRVKLAEKLAALKAYAFGGTHEPGRSYGGPVYYVPSRTLTLENACSLGIADEHALFGGVVPFAFVATKTITHALAPGAARQPEGWSAGFASAVHDAVLEGYSAFDLADAQRAGECLLARGSVRVKPALALGGRGQSVVGDATALRAALEEIDAGELASSGVALEQNLSEVTTYSVGQVCVGESIATYFGTQDLTRDNRGAEVYGGSDLIVARGDFDALLALDLGPHAMRAVTQAQIYDRAARASFSGFFASRRNYDIARGRDSAGAERCGVLEQSWRIGGASGAEIGALEAFAAMPELGAVRARTVEVYGEDARAPAGAIVYFHGLDEKVGFITKYTTVEPHAAA